jgi:hypothetical protein
MGRQKSNQRENHKTQSDDDLINEQFSPRLLRTKHREGQKGRVEDRRGHKKQQEDGGGEAASPLEQLQAPTSGRAIARVGVESLESIGRDIERAAAPLPEEFGRALREGMPAGEAVAALSAQLDALHRPVVEALRGLLSRLHEAKNLGSAEENARATEEVNRIAKSCNVDLLHDGNRVALLFREKKNYKTGLFALRSIDNNYSTAYEKVNFPRLDVAEASPPRSTATRPEQTASPNRQPGSTASQLVADIAERHDAAQRPFVEDLRGLLTRLHEAGSLGSYEENARAAEEVYRLAKACGVDLLYEGKPVSLLAIPKKNYKTGLFKVREMGNTKTTVYERVRFPALELSDPKNR